ncbi:MAG: hypothetical protein ABI635_02930 [Actinomycetota bacterium]
MRSWEAGEVHPVLAAKNVERASDWLAEHSWQDHRTMVLERASEVDILTTELTRFGGLNIADA